MHSITSAMNTRSLKLLAFVIPIMIVGIGFALTQITFNNTSTISAGQNIFLTQPTFTNPGSCPADADVRYINSGFSPLPWSLTAGAGPTPAYFCIDNQGTAADNPGVEVSGAGITTGTCPSSSSSLVWQTPTGVPASLAPHSASSTPVTINVCAGSFTPPGAGPSFSVTVT